jgi:hypothetical protein
MRRACKHVRRRMATRASVGGSAALTRLRSYMLIRYSHFWDADLQRGVKLSCSAV